jgi:hypothetical protein
MLFQAFAVSLCFGVLASCAPCPDPESTAGGGPPNSPLPAEISINGAKDIQLTQFLENLEVSFFSAGSANLSMWGADSFSNSSMDTVNRIAAVSAYPKSLAFLANS